MNRVYKLTPVSMYDVRGLEQWLETMAAQGLFLKKYRPLVCTFTRGEPKQVRYRLEPFRYAMAIDLPDEDIVELFQEYGWEFISGVHNEMIIFSSADPRAPEPHTDPDIQLEQWNKLAKKARSDLRSYLLLDLFVLLFSTVFYLWGGTPLAKLLSSHNLFFHYFLIINTLPQTLVHLARARELAAVIRELEGTPPRHRIWFPSRQVFSWMGVLVYVLLVVFLFLAWNQRDNDWRVTEFTPLVVTDPVSGERVGDTYGSASGFSPICWHQRQVMDFQPTEDRYLDLYINWYDLPDWLSFLAVPAARDLLSDAMKLNGPFLWKEEDPAAWTTWEYPGAGADWLSVADSEDGVYHAAAAALGDKVVLVRYIGSGDLTPYLDEIVDMVQ